MSQSATSIAERPRDLGATRGQSALHRAGEQLVPERLDGQRVLPEQQRRRNLVDVGLDGGRGMERISQADQALVGVDLHERDVWVRPDVDGLKRG